VGGCIVISDKAQRMQKCTLLLARYWQKDTSLDNSLIQSVGKYADLNPRLQIVKLGVIVNYYTI
jgi:hypothetical protein